MKKKSILCSLFACLLGLSSCSEKVTIIEVEGEIPEQDREYVSYYYYSYSNDCIIQDADLGEIGEFVSGPMYQIGDTLIIANNKPLNQSVLFYDTTQKKVIRKLQTWEHNGTQLTFPNNRIEDIKVADGKLYVSNMESRIDIFDLATCEFITRIGTGSWGDGDYQVLHTHAIQPVDSLIYVRTKNRMHVYHTKDLTTEKFQKIKWFARTHTNGYAVNNAFNSYQMISWNNKIYVTEFGLNGILTCIDPSLVTPERDINIINEVLNIPLEAKPLGLAVHTEDRLFIAVNGGSIHIYDKSKGEITSRFNSVQGKTFDARKLIANENYLWISDVVASKIIGIRIIKNEIKEYLSTRNIDKKSPLRYIQDAEGNPIVVNVETHEIEN